MNKLQTAVMSIAYVLIAIAILAIMDFGLYYLLNNLLFKWLNWFNGQSWLIMVLVFVFGVVLIFSAVTQLFSAIGGIIGNLIFSHFPMNMFTVIASSIVGIGNSIFCIIKLWTAAKHYSFVVVLELIYLSAFIWGLAGIVLPPKEERRDMFSRE